MTQHAPRISYHPLCAADLEVVREVLRRDDRFRLTHVTPLAISLLATPFRRRWIVRTRTEAAAAPDDWSRVTPPIFVVGFWRSGTTLLHELLAADREFAAPNIMDVLFPADALHIRRWKRRFLGVLAPTTGNATTPVTRIVDAVEVTARTPQEEELALCQLGAPSFFAASFFPRQRDALVEQALFLESDVAGRARWRAAYSLFLNTLALRRPGRRLLLKNPANSTRLTDILELYPDALFVRIDRDPASVIPSFIRMAAAGDAAFSLQGPAKPISTAAAERFHARVMARLDADWERIPEARKASVAYDALLGSPMKTIGRIYESLGIERSEIAATHQRLYWRRHARKRTPPGTASETVSRR